MKNWMCVVGAVIGAPIVLGVIASVGIGLVWLLMKLPVEPPEWVGTVIIGSMAVFMVGGLLAIIGTELYDHCKKHWGLK